MLKVDQISSKGENLYLKRKTIFIPSKGCVPYFSAVLTTPVYESLWEDKPLTMPETR